MKKAVLWFLIGAAAMFLAMVSMAAEPEFTVSADAPVMSAYVWRGQVVEDKVVLQPNATADWKGLSLNYWENYSTDQDDWTEQDITLSYTYGLLTAGIVNYHYRVGDVDDTQEAFVGLAYEESYIQPTLTVYRDLGDADGFYGNLELAHAFCLCDAGEDAFLNVSASVGMADSSYNEFYFGVDDNALNDANLTLSIEDKLTEHITLTPMIQYTWLLDGDIADTVEDEEIFFGGLNINYVF